MLYDNFNPNLNTDNITWFSDRVHRDRFSFFNSILSFKDTVNVCLNDTVLISHYDRLNNTNISNKKKPIENMIDLQTGLRQKELLKFFDFVRDFIYEPTVNKMIDELNNKKNRMIAWGVF